MQRPMNRRKKNRGEDHADLPKKESTKSIKSKTDSKHSKSFEANSRIKPYCESFCLNFL